MSGKGGAPSNPSGCLPDLAVGRPRRGLPMYHASGVHLSGDVRRIGVLCTAETVDLHADDYDDGAVGSDTSKLPTPLDRHHASRDRSDDRVKMKTKLVGRD